MSAIPRYVTDSIKTSKQRVLLVSPTGGAWYLGERVLIQGIAEDHQVIPEDPPISMLDIDNNKIKNIRRAVMGSSAYDFVKRNPKISYDEYTMQLSEGKHSSKVGVF